MVCRSQNIEFVSVSGDTSHQPARRQFFIFRHTTRTLLPSPPPRAAAANSSSQSEKERVAEIMRNALGAVRVISDCLLQY